MKRFGLVVAVETEINALLKINKDLKKLKDDRFEIYFAKINNNELYVIHSGCGEIFASIATQYLITKFSIDIIFNYGICGALRPNLETSSCCLIDSIINYDFDTDPIDHKGVGFHTEIKSLILKPNQELIDKVLSKEKLPLYRCASGDKFIDKEEDRLYLHQNFDADVCEMESAGIFICCYQNKIPCLFLKGISDSYSGGSQEFQKMASTSSLVAAKLFIDIIENF